MVTGLATLKDVAERAGVGLATVNRVLSNRGYVAEATRARVMAAVEETGYRPNALARNLKRQRSEVIGHLVRSTLPNPFFVKVARGVEDEARARGYTVMTVNVRGDAEEERLGVEAFLAWRVAGLIFSTPVSTSNVAHAVASGTPVVQVERPRTMLGHRITVQNRQAAGEAMEHLISLGHRRIAYVGGAPGTQRNEMAGYVESERFGAYRSVMEGLGLLDMSLVRFGLVYGPDETTAQGLGYVSACDWLDHPARPTAVMCSSDILAAGVLQAAQERKLRIPDDLSVVGFDDTLAEYLSPLLTSIRLPARRIGRAAVGLIVDQIGLGQTAGRHLELAAEFILRRSTGNAPG
jgi:LacI family transcriptional regulator